MNVSLIVSTPPHLGVFPLSAIELLCRMRHLRGSELSRGGSGFRNFLTTVAIADDNVIGGLADLAVIDFDAHTSRIVVYSGWELCQPGAPLTPTQPESGARTT